MATYYFRNTGNQNWNVGTNWSLTDGGASAGAFPGALDDAYFTSLSGNCTVNTPSNCRNLIFAGVGAGNYSGALSIVFSLTASGTVITLSPTMSFGGGSALLATSPTTATLTSNGRSIPRFRPGAAGGVFTFADDWTVTVAFETQAGTLLGSTVRLLGDITGTSNNQNISTTVLSIEGSSNQSIGGTFRIGMPITINKPSGTLTIGNILIVSSFTYVAGTVVCTGTFNIGNSAALSSPFNFTAGSINFNSFTIDTTGSTITLVEPVYVYGTLTYGVTTRSPVVNGQPIYARGTLTSTHTTGFSSGTSDLYIDGTGLQLVSTPSAGVGGIGVNNVYFNNPDILINGNLTFRGGLGQTINALQQATGAVGSLLRIPNGNITLNTSKINWDNVFIFPNSSASGAVTIGEDLYVNGTLTLGSPAVPTTINGGDIHARGNLTMGITTTQTTGTSTIYLDGNGPQTVSFPSVSSTVAALRINLIVNNTQVNFSGTIYYNTGTLTFLKSARAKGATLYLQTATTIINAHLTPWSFVNVNAITLTMNEFFSGTPEIRTFITPLAPSGFNISFTDGFEKISKFIKMFGVNIVNPNQLLVITDDWCKFAAQTAAAQNRGVRGINSLPNGISKGDPSVKIGDGFGLPSYLVADPNMISKI